MLKFQWNSLRIGDQVLVHDSRDAELPLARGVVIMVDSQRSINRVGIRITGTSRQILWPSYLAVHLEPHDRAELCWRCEAVLDPQAE